MKKFLLVVLMSVLLSASEITSYMDRAVVSSNNQLMALTSYANKVNSLSLWDMNNASLKMVKKFDFNDDSFFSNNMVFSHNNKYLAMGVNNYIYIWNTKTHELVEKISNYYEVSALEFSHDDTYLVVGASNHFIRVFSVENDFNFYKQIEGKELSMMEKLFPKSRYGTSIETITYSMDDRYLIIAFEDSNTKIYDTRENFKVVKEFNYKEDNYIYNVHFSNDGKKFYASKNGVEIDVFEAFPPFKHIRTVPKKTEEEVYGTALSKTNKYYLTSWDYMGKIKVWDIENNFKYLTTLEGHREYTTSLQFYDDDKYMISVGGDNKLIIWEVVKWKKVAVLVLDEEHHFTWENQ